MEEEKGLGPVRAGAAMVVREMCDRGGISKNPSLLLTAKNVLEKELMA